MKIESKNDEEVVVQAVLFATSRKDSCIAVMRSVELCIDQLSGLNQLRIFAVCLGRMIDWSQCGSDNRYILIDMMSLMWPRVRDDIKRKIREKVRDHPKATVFVEALDRENV